MAKSSKVHIDIDLKEWDLPKVYNVFEKACDKAENKITKALAELMDEVSPHRAHTLVNSAVSDFLKFCDKDRIVLTFFPYNKKIGTINVHIAFSDYDSFDADINVVKEVDEIIEAYLSSENYPEMQKDYGKTLNEISSFFKKMSKKIDTVVGNKK